MFPNSIRFFRRHRPTDLGVAGLALLLVAVVQAAPEAVAGGNPVDPTPVIRIGDYTVSRYLFEKARRQFTAPSGDHRRPSDAAASARWFRLHLAQHVIKAGLVAQGQLARPEVQDMTARMARHMMIQPRGVLYLALGGEDPAAFRRERRVRLLQECRFSASSETLASLLAALTPPFHRGLLPAEADVAALGPAVIASYEFEGTHREITAADFVRDFRQGIARLAPRDLAGLREQVEDMAVAEHDLAEARRLGLDRTPQFLEDRRNFALIQALGLYEREVLAPQVPVADEEVRAGQAQLDRFTPAGARLRPEEQAAAGVRRRLQREKLDALELAGLAREAGRIELLMDPVQYDIPVTDLTVPLPE